MQYKNTQLGTAMLALMGLVTVILVLGLISKPQEPIGFAFVIVGVIALLFSSLTIKVSSDTIDWFFGPKFWKKSLAISDVRSAQVIRTKWYYGFGIRLISTGWLYNVSGLTAVELKLNDGTTVSLGTDDPENLLAAINERLS
ncbi:hypothetical protein [Psychrobium sp. 1_MG-2023]|uniref:hypothetical protein n=1 Tax=Psychrobium sp. 1_MG-2023 TaxID=3062624 RepID=UPI000C33337B|nr:hypothetical protein [Psychrobium sp. 1_MG-2023]MDP2562449.1 hypothetical protein [Psychrobium sp. 1_MG-2023]PKF56175.1 hypothetical protein CW748_10995 [Alteromonadales bacterium alter-6D02]